MKRSCYCIAAGVLAAVVTLLCGLSTYGFGERPNSWSLPRLLERLGCEESRARDLEARRLVLRRRLDRKTAIIDSLAKGERSLAEATALMMNDEGVSQLVLEAARRQWPGKNQWEQVARHIVSYTKSTLRGEPNQEQVVARLEAELAARLGNDTLRLAKRWP